MIDIVHTIHTTVLVRKEEAGTAVSCLATCLFPWNNALLL